MTNTIKANAVICPLNVFFLVCLTKQTIFFCKKNTTKKQKNKKIHASHSRSLVKNTWD